jgi:hypothetical protein
MPAFCRHSQRNASGRNGPILLDLSAAPVGELDRLGVVVGESAGIETGLALPADSTLEQHLLFGLR